MSTTITDKLSALYQAKLEISGAIEAKNQSLNGIPFSGYAAKISQIQTGDSTEDANAEADKILSGYTAYAKGNKISGTVDLSNLTAENIKKDVTINDVTGTYEGTGGVDVSNVTATATDVLLGKKFVNSSGTEVDGVIPSLPESTYILDEVLENTGSIILPSGQYLSGNQTIRPQIQYFEVFDTQETNPQWSHSGIWRRWDSKPDNKTHFQRNQNDVQYIGYMTAKSLSDGITPYNDGWALRNGAGTAETQSINPEGPWTNGYIIKPYYYVMNTKNETNPISSAYVLSGYSGFVNGKQISGTIQSKSAQTYIPTSSNIVIPSGLYLTGEQIISGDTNLKAENIKKGETIFNITGTLQSGIDTSDATAVASTLLLGQTAYAKGNKITGTIQSLPESSYLLENIINNGSVIIPSGNYLQGNQIIRPNEIAYFEVTEENNIVKYYRNETTQEYYQPGGRIDHIDQLNYIYYGEPVGPQAPSNPYNTWVYSKHDFQTISYAIDPSNPFGQWTNGYTIKPYSYIMNTKNETNPITSAYVLSGYSGFVNGKQISGGFDIASLPLSAIPYSNSAHPEYKNLQEIADALFKE